MLSMPFHRPGQGEVLFNKAYEDKQFQRVGVIHALQGLFYDRPFVEVRCIVVRGGPDELHPSLVRLVVIAATIQLPAGQLVRRITSPAVSLLRMVSDSSTNTAPLRAVSLRNYPSKRV